MKIITVRCLRCHEPLTDHRKSMQAVSNEDADPKPGFQMNLYNCIANGGAKTGPNSDPRIAQLGAGRFMTSKQMR